MKTALFTLAASIGLGIFSIGIGAGGHGFLAASWLLCSPLPVRFGPNIFFAVPLLWAFIGWAAASGPRWSFPLSIASHWIVAVAQLRQYDSEDFPIPRAFLVPTVIWSSMYLVGLIGLSLVYARRFRQPDESNRALPTSL